MKVMSEERAEYIAQSISDNDDIQEQEVEHRNPLERIGFARINHIITLDTGLSDGAFRTYALLYYYWQRKHVMWANLETMAKVRGVKESTIRGHIKELVGADLISRQRRLGRSSLTFLEDLPQQYVDAADRILKDRQKSSGKTAKNLAVRPLNIYRREGEPIEGEPIKDNKSASQTDADICQPDDIFPSLGNNNTGSLNSIKDARMGVGAVRTNYDTVAEHKARIANAIAEYDESRSAVANPMEDKRRYKKHVSGIFADKLGHEYPTQSDKAAAGKCFEIKAPVERLSEYVKNRELPSDKESNAFWLVLGFDDWRAKGYPHLGKPLLVLE